jgi:Na+/H+-dicarboxylate symporter
MKKIAPHWQILIGMVLGIAVGFGCVQFDGGARFVKDWIEPFGTIFINLLKMVAVPLIVVSLIKGVSDLRDMSKLSKIGGRTMGLYIFTTIIATSIGLLMVNIFRPGGGISQETRDLMVSQAGAAATDKIAGAVKNASAAQEQSPLKFIVDIVPDNFISSMAQNTQMLQVIFFVVLFGIAMVLSSPEKNPKVQLVKDFFDGLNDLILKMIDIIMATAPFGVFALLAALVANAPNSEVFIALGKYALVVVAGLIFMILVDVAMMWGFTRRSPWQFLKAIMPAQLVAFSSSSSAATMPVTMECAEERLGVDGEVASFVIPVGATINMDGTALYQAVATVFIAQVYGNDLSMGAQLSIIATATLASIGSAAVPGAGMLMLVVILQSVGVDPAGIALIFAIDRPLDMCRTVTNITGDLSVATIVAKSMGKLEEPKMEA